MQKMYFCLSINCLYKEVLANLISMTAEYYRCKLFVSIFATIAITIVPLSIVRKIDY